MALLSISPAGRDQFVKCSYLIETQGIFWSKFAYLQFNIVWPATGMENGDKALAKYSTADPLPPTIYSRAALTDTVWPIINTALKSLEESEKNDQTRPIKHIWPKKWPC